LAEEPPETVAYPGIFFGGVQQIQLRTEDRENGVSGGGSPLVRGSGGNCNFVQEIPFHIIYENILKLHGLMNIKKLEYTIVIS
jgi:hypothetical protein